MTANSAKLWALGVALALGAMASAAGQVAASAPAQVEVPGAPGGPAGTDWHPFSGNAVRIYMADANSIATEGDVTRVQVAKAPLRGAAGDYSHAVETVEFRCRARESRSTTEIEYGPDGTEASRYDDPTAWEGYSPNSRDGFLAKIVCDGERSSNNTSSIKAWVDAGRKAG